MWHGPSAWAVYIRCIRRTGVSIYLLELIEPTRLSEPILSTLSVSNTRHQRPEVQFSMSGNKRSREWVDLTSSSPPPQAKHARFGPPVTPPVSSQPGPSSSFNSRDYLGIDCDETEIIDLSHDVDEDIAWVSMGVISGKIVGVRYYNGYATPGEQVMVKREPSNQHDSNAIRIDNVQGTQIGHLPRQLAFKLAPYLVRFLKALVFDID